MKTLISAAVLVMASTPAFAGHYGWFVTNGALDPTLARGTNDPSSPDIKNLVYAPGTRNANSDYLVLFLAGSGGTPDGYTDFMKNAADQGFYAMGLDYLTSGGGIPEICGCQTECLGHFYQQLVHGTDNGFFTAPLGHYFNFKGQSSATFSSWNSIENRFIEVQNWAFQHTPSTANGGIYWAPFQSNGAPNWQHIIVAGHSRGSDVATWILKNRPVHAALGFAAVDGYLADVQPTDHDTSLTYLSTANGGQATQCVPTASSPAWIPDNTSTGIPMAKLYLFDATGDGNFNPDNTSCLFTGTSCVGNDQYRNTIRLGWTGSTGPGGSNSTDRITSCTASTVFTSNWIVDNTGNGTHHSMINDDGVDSIGGDGRVCVWNHMLTAAAQ